MAGSNGGLDRVGVEAVVAGISQYVSDAQKFDRANQGIVKSQDAVGNSFKHGASEAIKFGAAFAGVQIGMHAAIETARELTNETIGAAIGFESSFAKVRQVLDVSEESFAVLREQNRGIARELPVSAHAVNELTAEAIELGIRGADNLEQFVRTMVKVGLATKATATEAAPAFAQIARVTGEDLDGIDRMAAAVDDLEQTFGANAGTTLAYARDIASIGTSAKLTSSQILGVAAAAVSVGAESSFAVTSTLTALDSAVTEGGELLTEIATTAGMSAEEFATAWRTDAGTAFVDFVEGLGRAGPDALRVLSDIGIGSGRTAGPILDLANSGNRLRQSIEQSSHAMEDNTALTEGAAVAMQTTAAQVQLAKNRFHDIGIELGTGLLPILVGAAEKTDGLNEAFQNLIERGELVKLMALAVAETIGFALFGPAGALIVGMAVMTQFDIEWEALWQDMPRPVQEFVIELAGYIDNIDSLLTDSVVGWEMLGQRIGRGLSVLTLFASGSAMITSGNIVGGIKTLKDAKDLLDEPFSPVPLQDYTPNRKDRLLQDQKFGDYFREQERIRKANAAALARRAANAGASSGPLRGAVPGAAPTIDFKATDAEKKAAADAEAAEKKRQAELERMIKEAQDAKDKAAKEDIDRINDLGSQIKDALRRQYDAEYDATRDSINARQDVEDKANRATLDRIAKVRDATVKAANDQRDAAVKSIEAIRDARLKSLDDQINALQAEGSAAEDEDLQRQLALAYDAKDRAEIQKKIAEKARADQIDALRDQQDAIKEAASTEIDQVKELADAKVEAARTAADAQTEAERARHEAAVDGMAKELDVATKLHAALTDDFALQSKARIMIANAEVDSITKLLGQDDRWKTAGYDMGESIKNGLRTSLAGTVAAALAGAPGTPQAAARANTQQATIDYDQATGERWKAEGRPDFILEGLRDELIGLGQVPKFATGLTQGETSRTMMALLHQGEVVVNRSQAAMIAAGQVSGGGPSYGAEAFARMFEGATFAGTPEENMQAARRIFEEMIAEQNGRDAYIAGVGR